MPSGGPQGDSEGLTLETHRPGGSSMPAGGWGGERPLCVQTAEPGIHGGEPDTGRLPGAQPRSTPCFGSTPQGCGEPPAGFQPGRAVVGLFLIGLPGRMQSGGDEDTGSREVSQGRP